MKRNYTTCIRLKIGDVIMMGYDNDIPHTGDEKCVWMGIYKGGDNEYCYLERVIIIEHIPYLSDTKPKVGEIEIEKHGCCAQQWWRKASAKQIKKYEKLMENYETIYKIDGGGQQVRQNQICGQATYYEVCEYSDYVKKAKCSGQNNYTNVMWHTDIETLQEWANGWVGCNVELVNESI